MRKLFFLFFITLSCISNKEEIINLDNYFSFETRSYERDGQIHTFLNPIILEKKDSLGVFINKHHGRFDYILGNRIDRDTLKTYYPDTAKVEFHFKENLKKDKFYKNFKALALLDKTKKPYSQSEIMFIASRFFLIEKSPNDKFRTRICRGINGLEEYTNKDYTVLEAVLFDAIFNRVTNQEKKKPIFLNNLWGYLDENSKNNEDIELIREGIFDSMSNDHDLASFLLDYFQENENNIPFKIVN